MFKVSTATSARKLSLLLLVAAFAMLTAGMASADEYKFPDGSSFTYQSGCQIQEVKQPNATVVSVMNPSDPMISSSVAYMETAGADIAKATDVSEDELKKTLPEGTNLETYTKTTVSGKDAFLTEITTEVSGMKIFTRSLTILNGEKAIIFSTAVTDPGKVADGRKAAEAMEQSVKF